MVEEIEQDAVTFNINGKQHPNEQLQSLVNHLNSGQDEVVIGAVGGAQASFEQVVGSLLYEAVQESPTYNIPDLTLDDIEVGPFTAEFEQDDGDIREVGGTYARINL